MLSVSSKVIKSTNKINTMLRQYMMPPPPHTASHLSPLCLSYLCSSLIGRYNYSNQMTDSNHCYSVLIRIVFENLSFEHSENEKRWIFENDIVWGIRAKWINDRIKWNSIIYGLYGGGAFRIGTMLSRDDAPLPPPIKWPSV